MSSIVVGESTVEIFLKTDILEMSSDGGAFSDREAT